MDWDNARRIREPVAWILLVVTAVGLLIGAWTLTGIPGGPLQSAVGQVFQPVGQTAFHLRALAATSYFTGYVMTALPVLAVLLVTVAGGLTQRAHTVTITAVSMQSAALGLGLISFFISLSTGGLPDAWYYVFLARVFAVAVAGLILTRALLRSAALRDSG